MTAPGVERVELRPGYTISRVIKGGWQLAGGHGDVDHDRAVDAILEFVDAGIDTFDCADIYTGVETLIGAALKKLRARGGSAAARARIHTKLVPDLDRLPDLTAADVTAIVERSLRRLGVERLDLLQFYWWDLTLGRPLDVLDVLNRLREQGKIELLGVTNWDQAAIAPFVERGFDIVSAQVQYSLLDARPAGAFSRWCGERGIRLLCYGVLAGGFLTEAWRGRADPGFRFDNRSLVKYRLIIDEFGGWDLFQELLDALAAVAERHGVTLAAVAARHMLDQPQVAAVIVGARGADHLERTLATFRLTLGDADRAAIDAVLARRHGPSGVVYGLERDRAGRHGRIMKYNLNADCNGDR